MKTRLLATLLAALLLLPVAVQAESLLLLNGAGEALVKLTWDGTEVKLKDPDGQLLLKGKPRDAGGRKYKDAHGAVLAKVAGDEHSFKLKSERGGLLWKVKFSGEKIKVSSRNDNAQADELRRKGADKWSVERDDRAYGKVKYYAQGRKTKVKDAQEKTLFQIENENFSPMAGILLLDGMPRQEAYIIMAEIWIRRW